MEGLQCVLYTLNYACSRVYGCVLVVHDCTSDAAAWGGGGGGGGGVTTRRCMQFSLLRPPLPPLQREVMFQKGGRNNTRVRYIYMHMSRTIVFRWARPRSLKCCLHCVYLHVISDTRLPPAFRAFVSGGRREPGDEARDMYMYYQAPYISNTIVPGWTGNIPHWQNELI